MRVGDCGRRVNGVPDIPEAGMDAITAAARSTLLEALLVGGEDPAELLADDPGRAMIMPLLAVERRFQNHPAHPLGHGAIDGSPVPARFVERWEVVAAADVVLASDGYAEIHDTLAATEGALARALAADPLCIGALRSTKGMGPGQVSFDPRATSASPPEPPEHPFARFPGL